jgi:TonB family protein
VPEVTRRFSSVLLMVLLLFAVTHSFAQDERKVKSRVDPTYPALAKRMNISGAVKVMVTIAPNGTVKATKVVGGNPVLVEAALDALRKWKFEPGPDDATQIVEFRFTGQ